MTLFRVVDSEKAESNQWKHGVDFERGYEMKQFAPMLGFSGCQALIRSYIGEGLRRDEALFAQPEIKLPGDTLRKIGIAEDAMAEILRRLCRRAPRRNRLRFC